MVPAPAVTNGQQGTYVYVVNADSTVDAAPGDGARAPWTRLAVIARGLEPGETVVTDGQFRLSPGARGAGARGRGGRDAVNLSELFIRRPVTTTLVMLGILLFGIVGYRSCR